MKEWVMQSYSIKEQVGAPAGCPEAITSLASISLVSLLCAASGSPPVVSATLPKGLAAEDRVGHQNVVDAVHHPHTCLNTSTCCHVRLHVCVGRRHRDPCGGRVRLQGGQSGQGSERRVRFWELWDVGSNNVVANNLHPHNTSWSSNGQK